MAPFSWLRWLRSWVRPQGKTFRKRSRVLSLEHLETRLAPATFTWKGGTGATAGDWNVASNWVENAVPTQGLLGPGVTNNLVFSSSGAAQPITNNNLSNLTVNSITISNVAGYQLGGNAITLGNPNTGNGLITLASALNESISMNVTLGGPTSPTIAQDHITVGAVSQLTLSGAVSGKSGADLISDGAGTLVLTHDNSGGVNPALGINGPIEVKAGILSITDAKALGNSAVATNTTTVDTNATLRVDNTNGTITAALTEQLLINGPGVTNLGALLYLGGASNNSAIWGIPITPGSNANTPVITLGSNAIIGVGTGTGNLTVLGVIADSGSGHSLTKEGAGFLVLRAADTYRGTTTINNGVIVVQNNFALGHAPIGNSPSNADDLADTATTINTSPTETGTLEFDGTFAPGGSLTISKQLLIINSPVTLNSNPANQGPDGSSVDNVVGNNTWAGNVILGGPPPGAITTETIGVFGGTTLTISGVAGAPNALPGTISSPNGSSLDKVGLGKLIFTTANSYAGTTFLPGIPFIGFVSAGTFISAGILEIEDSNALGPNAVDVFSGASLELADDFRRSNNSNDSVTKNTNHLTVANLITISGLGFVDPVLGPVGALYSHTGINNYTGVIILNDLNNDQLLDTAASGDSIGVDRAPFPTGAPFNYDIPSTGYLDAKGNSAALDDSLTVSTVTGGSPGPGGRNPVTPFYVQLNKVGLGQLIVPTAQSYMGPTNVQQGWVTIGNSSSFGIPNPTIAASVEPRVTVSNGAAIHVLAITGTPILAYNFVLAGDGINYPAYTEVGGPNVGGGFGKGALISLAGIASVTGNIQLNGQAGIGVEQVYQGFNAAAPNFSDPTKSNVTSQLTLTGAQSDVQDAGAPIAGPVPLLGAGGIDKFGSQRLIIEGPGTYSGSVNVEEGVLLNQNDTGLGTGQNALAQQSAVTVFAGAALELANNISVANGDIQGGTQIEGDQQLLNGVVKSNHLLVLKGTGNSLFGDLAPIVVMPASNNTTFNPFDPKAGPIGDPIINTDDAWRGPVSLNENFVITFSGTQQQPTLSVDTSALTGFSPSASVVTTTPGGISQITGAAQTAVQNLIFGGTITGGTFSITYNNTANHQLLTTNSIAWTADAPTLALRMQTALDLVFNTNPTGLSVSAVGSKVNVPANGRLTLSGNIDDATAAASFVNGGADLIKIGAGELGLGGALSTYLGTTYVNQGVLTVESSKALGGPGVGAAQQLTLSAFSNGTQFKLTFNNVQTPASITYTGVPATDVANIQAALNALSSIGGKTAGSVSVTTDATDTVFTITFGGNLVGFNQPTISGTVTGGPGGLIGPVATLTTGTGATVVANGASLQLQGDVAVAGEPLLVQGQGVSATPIVPGQWFAVGAAPASGGQTGGGQVVTGRVTGIAIDPTDSNTIYVATGGGGVWKTIDGGISWHPIFDAIPDVQAITNNLLSGTFTLTYIGPDVNGTLVTDTTTALPFNATPAQVQAALDALANIGGVGGLVTVTQVQAGPTTTYSVTFGGTLIGQTVKTLLATKTGPGTITTATTESAANLVPQVETIDVALTSGTFTLSFTGAEISGVVKTDTTVNLPFNATAVQVQKALNDLPNIFGVGGVGGVGGFVTVSQNPSTLQFTVAFDGNLAGQALPPLISSDPVKVVVNTVQTGVAQQFALFCGSLTMDPTNHNILYVGTGETNNSTDSFYGTGIYKTINAGLTWTLVVDNATIPGTAFNPFYGKGISKIIVDGNSPGASTLYVADGDGAPGVNEEQELVPRGLSVGTKFTVSFTGVNAGGVIVTDTTPAITWLGNSLAAFNSVAFTLQRDMQAFSNIGGIGGIVTVTVDTSGFFGGPQGLIIDFSGALSRTATAKIRTSLPLPGPGVPPPTMDVVINLQGGPLTVVNGTLGGPGVWRFTPAGGGTWFNLTNIVSANRATLIGQQTVRNAPPRTPGPDDDFRLQFSDNPLGTTTVTTQSNLTWSDVALVYADPIPLNDGAQPNPPFLGPLKPILYAALGNSNGASSSEALNHSGSANQTDNGVYWCSNPTSNAPIWYVGDPGIPQNEIQELTFTDSTATAASFNLLFNGSGPTVGVLNLNSTVDQSGIIAGLLNSLGLPFVRPNSITVALNTEDVNHAVYDVTFSGAMGFTPWPLIDAVVHPLNFPGISFNAIIKQAGGGADTEQKEFPIPGPIGFQANQPYGGNGAPGQTNGNIKLVAFSPGLWQDFVTVYAVVSGVDGNLSSIQVSPGTAASGGGRGWQATTSPGNFLNGQGAYDNSILLVNANTIYVGGNANNPATQDGQIFETTDGGATWIALSVDGSGKSPHTSQHVIVRDPLTGNILFGNDGGLWSLKAGSNTWNDLNGNLAIAQINNVSSNPTNSGNLFAAVQSNGIQQTTNTNLQNWSVVDLNNSLDMTGGSQVYVDPKNPLNVYAIELQLGAKAVLRKSTDGGVTWNTIPNPFPATLGIQSADVPLVLDQVNPDRLLLGGGDVGRLIESNDGGNNWLDINTPLGSVTAVAIAQYQGTFTADPRFPGAVDQGGNTYDPNTIYNTNGSVIVVTKDNGQTWQDCSIPGVNSAILDLEVDPRNRDTVYAVVNSYGAQIFKSINAGLTWTEIDANKNLVNPLVPNVFFPVVPGLPNAPAWKIAIDGATNNLFVGTDLGVYELAGGAALGSTTISGTWRRFGVGMPFAQVKDLELNQTTHTLIAGTHGRSVFELTLDGTQGIQQTIDLTGASTGLTTFNVSYLGSPASAPVITYSGNTTASATLTPPIDALAIQNALNALPTIQGAGAAVTVTADATDTIFTVTFTNAGTLTQAQMMTPIVVTVTSGDIASRTVTLTTGAAFSGTSGQSTWTGPVILAGNATIGANGTQTIQNGVAAAQLTIVGTISDQPGVGPSVVTKNGFGNVVFAGADTYAGLTDITQGALVVDNDHAITGVNTIVESGAALALESSLLSQEPVTLHGNGIPFDNHNTGAIHNLANPNTINGVITLATDSTIGVDSGSSLTVGDGLGNGTITNQAGGHFNLVKELTGPLTFLDPNTYGGGSSTFNFLVNVTPSATYLDGTLIAQGALDIANALGLGNAGNTTTVLDGAQLQLSGNINVPGTQSLRLAGTGIQGSGAMESIAGANTWNGRITLDQDPAFGPATSPSTSVAINVLSANPVSDAQSAAPIDSLTITGVIGDDPLLPSPFPVGLVVNFAQQPNAGVLILDPTGGKNTYNGGTTVAAGDLRIQQNGALGGIPQVQTVTIPAAVATGQFTLTFNGQTTTPLDVTDFFLAADMLTALQALSNIGPTGVTNVTQNGNVFAIVFGGALGATAQPQLIATPSGIGGANVLVNTLGTVVNGGASLQLDGSKVGGLNVVGGPLTLNGVGFNNAGALENFASNNTLALSVPVILASSSDIGADGATKLTVSGTIAEPFNQQVLQIVGATAGTDTFTLTFNRVTTAPITYQGSAAATALAIQNALNAPALTSIAGVGGSVTVIGDPTDSSFSLNFGGTLDGIGLPLLSVAKTAGAGTLTLTSSPVLTAAPSLTKVGGGDVILTNANTFTSNTFVNAGGLNIGNATALGSFVNSVQLVTISGPSTGGFILTFKGVPTAVLSNTSTAAQVQTALQGLSNIGTGNVSVTGADGGPYTVTFVGALAGQTEPKLVAVDFAGPDFVNIITNGAFVDVLQDGSHGTVVNPGVIQTVTVTGTTGTFTLQFNGQGTPPLSPTDPNLAFDMQIALNGLLSIGLLPNPGSVNVIQGTGANSNVYTVIFGGSLAESFSVTPLTSASSGGNALATIGTSGGAALRLFNNITVTAEQLTLDGTGINNHGALENLSGNNTWTQPIPTSPTRLPILLAGNTTIGADAGSLLTLNNAVISDGGNNYTVTKVGTGTLAETGTHGNAYTGLTTVIDGTLQLNISNSTGSDFAVLGNLVVGDATGSGPDVAMLLQSNQIANPATSLVSVNSDGVFDVGTSAVPSVSQTVGILSVNGGAVNVDNTAGTGSQLSAGALNTKDGTISLNGANSQITTPAFNMSGGFVHLNGAGSALTLTGSTTATSDATGTAVIDGVGNVVLSSGPTATFTINAGPQAVDLLVAAPITGAPSSVGLSKVGLGTLKLTADELYTGTTTINAGALLADGPNPSQTVSTVTLNGGMLGGNGTVGLVTTNSGVIQPGDTAATAGILTINNGATAELLNPTAGSPTTSLSVALIVPDINTGNPGTGHGLLKATGDVNINGAILTGTAVPLIPLGNQFTVLTTPGTVSGTFTEKIGNTLITLTDGSGVLIGGENFIVHYFTHTVVLTRALNTATVVIASSANPSVYGQDVTFTAQVTPQPGAGPIPAADTVTYTFTSTDLPFTTITQTLPVGTAFDPEHFGTGLTLLVDTYTVTATFNGDATTFAPASAPSITQTVTKNPTSIFSVVAVPSAPVYGLPVTFTATIQPSVTPVTPFFLAPGGTAVFTIDATSAHPVVINNVTVNSAGTNGTASVTLSNQVANLLGAGVHTVQVSYSGDNDYVNSISTATFFQVTIATDNVTVGVTSSTSSTSFGAPVTFTATVSPASSGSIGTVTGSVTFRDNSITGSILGTGTLSNGVATLPNFTGLSVGTHTVFAIYGVGDGNYNPGSGSLATPVTVTQGNTSVAVTPASSTAVFGQSVTFTATVSPVSPASGTATGTVTFSVDGTPIPGPSGTVTLSAGTASIALNNFSVSATAHTIDARYNGDGNFNTSVSSPAGTAKLTVNQDTTTTVVQSSVSTSVFGQSVTFTATVSANAPGSGFPGAGELIAFFDGATQIGTGPLNATGVATFTTSSLAVGGHTIAAQFAGDVNLGSSNGSLSIPQANPFVVTKANTTTTVTASPANTSPLGTTVTFTATVTANSPGSGLPGIGDVVNFFDGSNFIGFGTLNAGGVATFMTSSLPVGPQNINATFTGDASYNTSNGALASPYIVTKGAASSNLTASANPTFGQPITFTDSLSGAFGTPTGTVNFFDGANPIASNVSVVSGVASATVNGLTGGTHNITAVYSGDNTYASGSTGTLNPFTVNRATPNVGVVGNPASTVFGQTVTFIATVSGPGGTPAGNVRFMDGATQIGATTTLVNGQASVTTATPLVGGSHNISVVYTSTDSNFGNNTGTLTYVVNPAGTTTTLSADQTSILFSQSVTFTASVNVNAPGTVTPAGAGNTVTFHDNTVGVDLATKTLNASGVATFTTSGLSVGPHNIVAIFNANNNFATSTSNTVTEVVKSSQTSTTAISPATTTGVFGQTLNFTATVSGNFGTPTGTATFAIDGIPVSGPQGTVTLSNGTATFSTFAMSVGRHTVSVTYNGDTTYGTSSSTTPANVTVVKDNGIVTVTSSLNPSLVGQTVTFTATVNAAAPGSGTPTGTVTFTIDGTTQSTPANNLSNGKATLTVTNLPQGSHTIKATYTSGDGNFNPNANPGVLTQTVTTGATKLSASVSPSPVSVGANFTVTANALNAQNQLVTGFNGPATITLVSFPTGGTITGNLSSSFVNGVAMFSGLKVTVKGSYVIRITSGNLSTTLTITTL